MHLHGLAIGQQDYEQIAISHFRDLHPATNAPIVLHRLPKRRPNCKLNLFVPNERPIRPETNCFEVVRNLHADYRTRTQSLTGNAAPARAPRPVL